MLSLPEGPALSDAVDSSPPSDLLQLLAQEIKTLQGALEESVAAQRELGTTQSAQAAIIETLKAAATTSEQKISTLEASLTASEHETKALKAAVKLFARETKATLKISENETNKLKAAVETLEKSRRPRNLVICIDGTSNQFGTKNTNVVELYHRLIRDENQLTFYNSGIGTFATPSWKSWRYWRLIIYNKIDLAIAWNFEGIIISAYRWLSENYEPGDKIFVFGFSRGAYQIRALAAMIDSVGLLRKGNLDQIPFAYELYAETKKAEPWTIVWIVGLVFGYVWTVIVVLLGWGRLFFYFVTRLPRPVLTPEEKPDIKEMCKHFKDAFSQKDTVSQKDVVIEFAGAWDTVSSVGFIRDKTLPGTTDGMGNVKYFRHALALHERRVKFLNENSHGGGGPTMEEIFSGSDSVSKSYVERPHTKEVWFAGSHGDIGGGAVSNLRMNKFGPSLRWMLYEAVASGLRITSAPETEEDLQVHNSLTSPWTILEYLPITRLSYKDRDGLTSWPHRGRPRQIQLNQKIHSTALMSQDLWRAHLPEGIEWNETSLKNRRMVEVDRYAEAKEVIARLSHLPPAYEDLDSLRSLVRRDDGKLALQNTIAAEVTLMALVQLQVDDRTTDREDNPWNRWWGVTVSALIVLDLDTAERKQGEAYSIGQLLLLVNAAKREKYVHLDRLKGLLIPGLIKKLKELFGLPSNILEDNILQALHNVSTTDHWKRLQDIPEVETKFITLLQRYSWENDPGIKARRVIADVVLLLIQEENRKRWDDKYYVTQRHELGPILARVSERNDPQLLEWFEKRYAPAQVQSPFHHRKEVVRIAWMPDAARIVSGFSDEAVRVWDVETGAIVGAPQTGRSGLVTRVLGMAVSRDGSKIASSRYDGETIRVWNAQTAGAEICCLAGHMDAVVSLAFSPDGAHIASGSWDHTIRVWDIASGGTVVGPIQGHESAVFSVAYSPNGSRIVSGSHDKSIRVWNATTGEEVWQRKTASEVNTVAYSPDGKRIVAGGGQDVLVLDAETRAIIRRLDGPSRCVAFSPDGKKLASTSTPGSHDHTVRLWDAETGDVLDVLRGHRDRVYSVAFSPNGERIASASQDSTVRIWDATGAWRRTIITNAAFDEYGGDGSALFEF